MGYQSINQAFIAGSMAHKNTQKTKKKGTHTHTHNYKLLTNTNTNTKDFREIPLGSPPAGAPNAGGVGQNQRRSTNNRLYLENGTR